jgi:alkylation response protein AidB-like acyl-CoA dehydrogenase
VDLSPNLLDDAFRAEVRAYLAENLPADLAERNRGVYHPTREDAARWTRILSEKGWSAPSWPVEAGGPGWSLAQQLIFAEEVYLANAPRTNLQGFSLAGPVIYTYGNQEQKGRYLGPILRGEEFWSQGFSEPNSGSDLASLRTRADRDGDHYVVNGQKIWTSDAHKADMLFCLVRTDQNASRPQRGISFLLIDLKTPGITIRPIRSIDDGHGLNEVFLDNVRVPVANLVGEENMGWTYARFLLGNERAFTAAELPYCRNMLRRVRECAARMTRDGRPLLAHGDLALRIARFDAEIRALHVSVLRLIDMDGDIGDSALPSVLKIRGSELQARLSALMVEVAGDHGLVRYRGWDHGVAIDLGSAPPEVRSSAADYYYRRAAAIYGGSNEIQRNIISRQLLKA